VRELEKERWARPTGEESFFFFKTGYYRSLAGDAEKLVLGQKFVTPGVQDQPLNMRGTVQCAWRQLAGLSGHLDARRSDILAGLQKKSMNSGRAGGAAPPPPPQGARRRPLHGRRPPAPGPARGRC
jgi:hypothetical protein